MNYCKTMITFFYTLNTELLYDPTAPHLSSKAPENEDSDIYVTKFPVALFIKDKNSPSCLWQMEEWTKCVTHVGCSIIPQKEWNSDPRSTKQMKLENRMLMEKSS